MNFFLPSSISKFRIYIQEMMQTIRSYTPAATAALLAISRTVQLSARLCTATCASSSTPAIASACRRVSFTSPKLTFLLNSITIGIPSRGSAKTVGDCFLRSPTRPVGVRSLSTWPAARRSAGAIDATKDTAATPQQPEGNGNGEPSLSTTISSR